ncbi:MAG: hypothetical protein COB81_02125 [Flavobacteriaceae bacterium]|nr:MAG: hypothetical protein COB81_02125 [Flavobacteriaceae bacterium]
MNIGIAGPIEMASLREFFPGINKEYLKLGIGGTAVNLLIIGLLNEGHTVTVFTLDPNVKIKLCIKGIGIKVIFGHFRKSVRLKTVDFCSNEFMQIKNFIIEEKENLDIVNAHWSYEFAIGTILSKVPHIITFRDDAFTILKLMKQPYRFTRLCMDFWVRRKALAFSYNSKYLQHLIKLPGVVIPNPVKKSEHLTDTESEGNTSNFNVFFMSNGWSFRKNPETAIFAFASLRKENPNIHLFLIGVDFEKNGAGYHWTKKKVGLDRIHFIGPVPHKKVLEMLQTCKLMLHTSREESFGNNLIEAMVRGIPVIGGEKAGAVPWVLDNGKAGILVDIEKVSEVAAAMQKILSSETLYLEYSERGIMNVAKRFSLEVVTKQYIEAFVVQINNQKTNESFTFI